jgi:O-antigen/teichoic acid export membrane protein
LLREITAVVEKPELGLYGLISQIVTYLWLLQIGLDAAASQGIAVALGRGDPAAANRVYHQLARFNRYGAGVCVAVVTLATVVVPVVFTSNEGFDSLVTELIGLLGLGQVVGFFTRAEVAALSGSQRLATVNFIRFGQTLIAVGIAYVLLTLGWGVRCQPAADLLTQAGGYLLLRRATRATCDWYSPAVTDLWTGFYRVGRYAFFSSLSGLAAVVDSIADVLILQASPDGLNAIAYYTVWHRAPTLLHAVTNNLLNSAFPTLTTSLAADVAAGRRLFQTVSHPVVGLTTLSFLGLGLWLPPFVHLWVQGRYDLANGGLVAWSAAGMTCIRLTVNLLVLYVYAVGRTAFVAWLMWTQCLVKIAAAVALVPMHGLAGLYLAYCICSLIPFAALLVLLRRINLTGREFSWRVVALTTLAGTGAALGPISGCTVGQFAVGVFATMVIWAGIVAGWKWLFDRHSSSRQSDLIPPSEV